MTDSTADAVKLLPCPFCGGDVKWVDTDWAHHVDCFSCRLIYGPMGQTKEQIITAWNTRPQPAPPEGEPTADDYERRCRDLRQIAAFMDMEAEENGVKPTSSEASILRESADEIERMREWLDDAEKALAFWRKRLCVAARPKVEDAPIKELNGVIKFHNERAEAAEAKLAERESELTNCRDHKTALMRELQRKLGS